MLRLKSFAALALLALAPAAFAADYAGNAVSAYIQRSGKSLDAVETHSRELTTTIDRVTTDYRWVTEYVPVVSCPNPSSEGKGDWKNFYTVPKAQKPAALASAILGIGPSTAQKLVDGGYFSSKPRSWEAFSAEIERADRAIGTGFSYEVLSKYGQQNMANLGYSDGTCTTSLQPKLVLREYEVRTPYRTVTKTFRLEVQGPSLLRGESERLVVNFDGIEQGIQSDSAYNDYSIVGRDEQDGVQVYRLEARRKLAPAPIGQISARAEIIGGQVVLKVTDGSFDADVSDDGESYLVVEIMRSSLLIDKKLASFERKLDGAYTEISTGVRPGAGKKVYAKYSLRKVGSRYHSAQASGASKTDKTR